MLTRTKAFRRKRARVDTNAHVFPGRDDDDDRDDDGVDHDGDGDDDFALIKLFYLSMSEIFFGDDFALIESSREPVHG